MQRNSGRRARDADRDDVVAALQDAYVDGQLDSDERERRTTLALAATHVAELRELVHDLQLELPEPEPIPVPASGGSGWKAGVAVAAALAAVAAVIGFAITGSPDNDPAPSPEFTVVEDEGALTEVDQPVVLWSEIKHTLPRESDSQNPPTIAGLDRWSVTEENVNTFLAAYRGGDGTSYFDALQLYPTYVSIGRPVSGSRPTIERWHYGNGRLSVGSPSADGRDRTLMDLDDLDVAKLFDNIAYAIQNLGVPDAEVLYVSVDIRMAKPEISIYVQDPYDSSGVGYLTTTLAGKVFQEVHNR